MSRSRESHAVPQFRLLTFGGLSLVDSSGAAQAEQPRRLALLALLSTAGDRGMSRDRLVAWLSPESPTKSARHSLHQLIYYLRQQAGDDVFEGTDPLRLNPAVIAADHAELHVALERGDLTHAVSLYRGPFLDGFHLGPSEFEEWAAGERARWAGRYGDALFRLASDAHSAGEHTTAIGWWRRLSAIDPVSGRVALGLMQSLAAAGDAPAALRHAQVHDAFVRAEVGRASDPQVTAFAARLRVDDAAVGVDAPATRPDVGSPVDMRADRQPAERPSAELAAAVPNEATAVRRAAPRRRRTIGLVVFGLMLVASAWTISLERAGSVSVTSTSSPPGAEDLLVGDIMAPSTDSLAARALTELLRGSLGGGPFRVVSRLEMDQTLRRMAIPVTTHVDADVARELALRGGHEAIVTATLSPIGRGFLLSARLTSATGTERVAASESAVTADALIPAVVRLAKALRSAAGDSLESRVAMTAMQPVSTHSLQALSLYTQAQEASFVPRGRPQQSPEMMALLREAIRHDSTFAMAHRRLGTALGNLGFTYESLQEYRAAERFSDRLAEVERLSVLSTLYLNVREHDRSIAAAKQILLLQPGNLFARSSLILNYQLTRRDDVAEREIPSIAPFGIDPFWTHLPIFRGRTDEALDSTRAYYRRMQDSSAESAWRRSGRFRMAWVHAARFEYDSALVYAVKGDANDPGVPHIVAASQFSLGRIAEALTTQQRRRIEPNGELLASAYTTAESYTALATLLITGDRADANRRIDAVLADTSYRNRNPANRHIRPILALAVAGRAAEARRELTAIERAANADVRAARQTELALARGAVALSENRPGDAIEAFRRAAESQTMGSYDACRVCALPWLGRAYDVAGQPDSATAVYERYLSMGDPFRFLVDAAWRAVTLRRLGTLHTQLGDTTLAVKRLSELVDVWRGADAELQPVVERARRQLAGLRPRR